MIDLKDVTFIIPIRVESEDRRINTQLTISYLCNNFNTNIIILEHDVSPKVPAILDGIDRRNTTINYHFLRGIASNNTFHRTMMLNMMLNIVNTPVVVNYDVDIMLRPHTYVKCRNQILDGGYDLVYPYHWGDSQYQVKYSGRNKLIQSQNIDVLSNMDCNITRSEYGHCQFFNTKSYIGGGMENEQFISYAPEDQERGYRFKKLGYKVMWSTDFVYHIEHTRGVNSSTSNPMMDHNNRLFEYIKSLSVDDLRNYYANVEYIKKYSTQ